MFLYDQIKNKKMVSICLAYSFGNSIKLDKYQMALVASEFIAVTFPF